LLLDVPAVCRRYTVGMPPVNRRSYLEPPECRRHYLLLHGLLEI
jgi:hypothetical protein